ncbi:MAG: ribonuclease Y [Bdellovibrio sp. CG12_big_fil_rev_8_21_14_0_65_39_13]|nr:MAG: ribonuclease Y [Bdellovibrio sp. CG22_combo_CG10-13_8_21_14_all_39_27]PIQ58019.1 MAG: ribonuclease Y [Bdellovibrio sp. CG12_big_fil_rev_8_21_14_0_65_39_13]PIR36929.1 MAG: ribonuclease Y [Bdellovibrio sp. CG11_big_fil_rev_8_21_14_0_20_39_38]PJB53301.1 MAG: ribonuclease Y [Bdellovibrio sp. CG_4_9_14_3_um_filter_39_7]
MDMTVILASVLFLIVGAGVGYFVRHKAYLAEVKEKQGKADEIIEKAKDAANDIKYKARKEAKEQAREEKEQFEKEVRKRENDLKSQEKDLATKEAKLDTKLEEHQAAMEKIKAREEEITLSIKKVELEVEKYKNKQAEISEKLTQVASLTRDEAKAELMKVMEEEARVDFSKELTRIESEYKEQAEEKSKRIVGVAIQRFAGEYVAEKTISTVDLPSDDLKGRLIGREGRNIRAFEQICGVDLIIDDTPEIVVVSSFNVIRREIARRTIEKLISDGRIHPAKIEEFHDKSKTDMEKHLLDLGQKAQMEIGVHGIHPEVLKLVGALNFRTSYTQNQYQHALEAAFICGAMAAEMGLNVKQARRAGLLHDIGKVLDASAEGSHAVIGADFAKKYGESPDIVHAIRAHHDDEKPESILAHLVAASDALSGARPGARKAMMESYVSRLTDIEEIVNSFEGVTKSYAISGGREVRVFVENDRVTDEQTVMLSRDIAKKIEEEMSYPGTIKITVVRETKAVGVAR